MNSSVSVRKHAPWLVMGAALLCAATCAWASFPSPVSVTVSNVSLSLDLLYPGQTTVLSYTLSGSAMANPGAVASVKIDLLSGTDVVKSVSIPAGSPGAVVGANTVSVVWADAPIGGPYNVRVTAVGGTINPTTMIRVSDPADPNLQFNGPRGVDVNKNPGNPAFGRIYVSEGNFGTTKSRTTVDGLYLLNPNLTPAFPTARLTSADIGIYGPWTGSSHSPFRVYVDSASTVWLSDAADAHPALFFTDADATSATTVMEYPFPAGGSRTAVGLVRDSNGTEVFGDCTSVWVEGAGTASRKVFLAIQEIAPVDAVWLYDIPTGDSNIVQVPNLVADPTWTTGTGTETWYCDFVRDQAGNTYVVNRTSNNAYKFDSTGTLVSTLPLGVVSGTIGGASGICIDEARDVILMCTNDGRVLQTNKAFTEVTTLISGMGATCRDIAMDTDGWVYVANETDKALHVYAPPGAYTTIDASANAAQTLTVKSIPIAGDIAPIGPTGINMGTTSRFGDGKVDLLDSVQTLRVYAGLQTLP